MYGKEIERKVEEIGKIFDTQPEKALQLTREVIIYLEGRINLEIDTVLHTIGETLLLIFRLIEMMFIDSITINKRMINMDNQIKELESRLKVRSVLEIHGPCERGKILRYGNLMSKELDRALKKLSESGEAIEEGGVWRLKR